MLRLWRRYNAASPRATAAYFAGNLQPLQREAQKDPNKPLAWECNLENIIDGLEQGHTLWETTVANSLREGCAVTQEQRTPGLFLFGEKSGYNTHEAKEAARQAYGLGAATGPDGHAGGPAIEVLPDAGHFLHTEKPAEFDERVLAFGKRLGLF